mmetsp:Transcript_74394/g.86353  ORF Transcript_74394/g.86353 Transcript_74394/m.86353 type:complete len:159 (+) Transcript_74394:2-478(+)
MEKKTHPDKVYLATAYAEVTYRPANVLMFKAGDDGKKVLVASGELKKPDPLKVILKRVILTGYPLKIHKRKAVIRMMFFNQPDVKYFMPTELVTKFRLRGHIRESLGTHGLMKCIFSNNLKPNDTICMYLYKRVFPKWPFEKVDTSFNTKGSNVLAGL